MAGQSFGTTFWKTSSHKKGLNFQSLLSFRSLKMCFRRPSGPFCGLPWWEKKVFSMGQSFSSAPTQSFSCWRERQRNNSQFFIWCLNSQKCSEFVSKNNALFAERGRDHWKFPRTLAIFTAKCPEKSAGKIHGISLESKARSCRLLLVKVKGGRREGDGTENLTISDISRQCPINLRQCLTILRHLHIFAHVTEFNRKLS